MREHRARKRGLTPVPTEPMDTVVGGDGQKQLERGRCELALLADIERLGVRESQPALCAAAEQMCRILDDRRQVTTQPSACGKLLVIMSALHKEAAPRRGRLAVIQQMSHSPDAG